MKNVTDSADKNSYQRFVLRAGRAFYLYLAIAVSIIAIVDLTQLRIIKGMQISTSDMMLQHRLHYPKPDSDILIVDVDEASLAAMSEKWGRWPWPRQVMGDVIEGLEAHKPKAIVVDVLFSSFDKKNEISDQYLTKVLTRHQNIFVPYALLDELEATQIQIATLPGTKKILATANDNATTSVALPYFSKDIPSNRIGINNIVSDDDGVVRRFALSQDRHGWEIPSLPLQFSRAFGYPFPAGGSFSLNWRGPPYSFKRMSFSYVYAALKSGSASQLTRDFEGKIVIIGSTAVSLFDLKTSPMAPTHPGVEIMANILDNLKNGNPLLEFSDFINLSIIIAFIWLLAFAFYTRRTLQISDATFIILQILFIFVSYLLLNISNLYIDFTTPITFGAIYFAIARIFEYLSVSLRANRIKINSLEKEQPHLCAVMVIQHPLLKAAAKKSLQIKIEKLVDASRVNASKIDQLIDFPSLIRSMFDNTIIVYWIAPETNDVNREKIRADAIRIGKGVMQLLKEIKDIKADGFQIGFKEDLLIMDSASSFNQGTDIVAGALISRQPIDSNWYETFFLPGVSEPGLRIAVGMLSK